MTHDRRRRALARKASSALPSSGGHPLARPGVVPWVVVIILVITVMIGNWAPAEVLGLLTLVLGIARVAADRGA